MKPHTMRNPVKIDLDTIMSCTVCGCLQVLPYGMPDDARYYVWKSNTIAPHVVESRMLILSDDCDEEMIRRILES